MSEADENADEIAVFYLSERQQDESPGSGGGGSPSDPNHPLQLPLIISLNCIEDVSFEQQSLSGIASVEHVALSDLSDGRIESSAVVLLHSLAFLPRAAQRRLQSWQLIICLGSSSRVVDSALATDLGLRVVHIDVSRADEIADSVMALLLVLLRRSHLLARHSSASSAVSGWVGSVQQLCRGMRRCRGLVVGIIGKSASARCLVERVVGFRMSVIYFDVLEGKGRSRHSSIAFPPAARKMDTLHDLLAASDIVSLHCVLSDDTLQILNAECLQHIKPGAIIVNTGSSQLIDDCVLKQLLIDGTIAGCALDGAEGPQWMEAWIREMPNVIILPRSADYSEEAWMEVREKAICMLQSFLLDGVIPNNDVSDEDEEKSDIAYDEQSEKQVMENPLFFDAEQRIDVSQFNAGYNQKVGISQLKESHVSVLSQNIASRSEGKNSSYSKKGKKRSARQRSERKSDDFSGVDSCYRSHQDDDTATSTREQSSRFTLPEDSKNKQVCLLGPNMESVEKPVTVTKGVGMKSVEILKDGFVIALHARDHPGFHVSRQRVPGAGWFLDTISSITKQDPAAQFLVSFRSKDTVGLRSLAAGGKLLQINRRMEFVFASYNFDVWESWKIEGYLLEECRLVNCRNPLAVLDVHIEILAAVGEEDGISRWLD
ncbi:hypothetical protein KFK09_028085 [Dendrobium nobile]|uniref:D-isomer specific 2-hydroxyacid dehydrogenase NAD-binding domain-containing protein n=1 Tax=Dendrobium nobile TaxID=94219 RepID=A0A8T3A1K7_DENNO|nr:hypothetical protein KFK09_028085 [Dendrobium nobile]